MNPTPEDQHPQPAPAPARLPAPTGPNWGLLAQAVLLFAGSVVMLAYLGGARMTATISWPAVFVVSGLGLVLVGQIGLFRRRRSRRR